MSEDLLTYCCDNDTASLQQALLTEQSDGHLHRALQVCLAKNHMSCVEIIMDALFAISTSIIQISVVFNICIASGNIAGIRMALDWGKNYELNLHEFFIINLLPVFLSENIAIVTMLINYGLDINSLSYVERIEKSPYLPNRDCLYYTNYQHSEYDYLAGEYDELLTPLSECAKFGRMSMIKFLLEHGIRVEAHDHLAARKAACWGQIDALKLLYEHDATNTDPNVLLAICLEELTFKLHVSRRVTATANGVYQVCSYLMENGASVHNVHLLHQAVIHRQSNIIKLFLQYGADINIGTECHITDALFACCDLNVIKCSCLMLPNRLVH